MEGKAFDCLPSKCVSKTCLFNQTHFFLSNAACPFIHSCPFCIITHMIKFHVSIQPLRVIALSSFSISTLGLLPFWQPTSWQHKYFSRCACVSDLWHHSCPPSPAAYLRALCVCVTMCVWVCQYPMVINSGRLKVQIPIFQNPREDCRPWPRHRMCVVLMSAAFSSKMFNQPQLSPEAKHRC